MARSIIAIPVVFTTLALICVALRLWIRWTRRGGIWIDDGLIIVSMTLSIVIAALVVRQIPRGYGQRHDVPPTDEDLMLSGREVFFAQNLYFVGIGLCKMSILFFYLRLTKASGLQYAVRATMAVVVMSSLALALGNIFECWPVQYAWGGVSEGRCFNRWVFWTAGAAINVVTDTIVYTLPIPTIWRMKMLPMRQKIALVLVFGLGLSTIAAGVVRLAAMVQQLQTQGRPEHPTWNHLLASMSSTTELNTGIIGACLPSLKILLSCLFASGQDTKRNAQQVDDDNQVKPDSDDDDKRLSNSVVAAVDQQDGSGPRNQVHGLNRHLPFFHKPLRRDNDRWHASDLETTVKTFVGQPHDRTSNCEQHRSMSSEWPTSYGHNNRVSSHEVRVEGNYNASPPQSSCSLVLEADSPPRQGTSSTEVTTPVGRTRSLSGTGSDEHHGDTPLERLPRKYSDGTGSHNVHIIKTTRISVSRSASVSGGF